jgi:HEAT repeat protein
VNEACAGFAFPSPPEGNDEPDIEPKLRTLPVEYDPRADASVRKIAVKALANLAWKACNQEAIVDCGGLKPLVALLSHGDDNERECAAVALCNLCAGPASCVIRNRTALAMMGGIKPLQLLNRVGSTDGQRSTSGRLLALLSDSGFDVTAPKV